MEAEEPRWEQEEEEEEESLECRRSSKPRIDHKTSDADAAVVSSNGDHGHGPNGDVIEEEKSREMNAEEERGPEEAQEDPAAALLAEVDQETGSNNGQQSPEKCVYYDQDEGGNLTLTSTGEVIEQVPGFYESNVSSKDLGESKDLASIKESISDELNGHNLSSSDPQQSTILQEEPKSTVGYSSTKEIVTAYADLIHESDLDEAEFDVEKVLQKQNTHDLYCPNCNSCITRRVILRKRKRKVRISDEDVKRNKLESATESSVEVGISQAISDQVSDTNEISVAAAPTPAAIQHDHDSEPEVFRCLSCLSFFIPTGKGSRLFATSRDRTENKVITEEQTVVKKNWFSFFSLNKGRSSIEQGTGYKAEMEENVSGLNTVSAKLNDQGSQSSSAQQEVKTNVYEGFKGSQQSNPVEAEITSPILDQEPQVNRPLTIGSRLESKKALIGDKGNIASDLAEHADNQPFLPGPDDDQFIKQPAEVVQFANGEPKGTDILVPQPDGLKLLVNQTLVSQPVGKAKMDQMPNLPIEKKETEGTLSLPKPIHEESDVNMSMDILHEDKKQIGPTLADESVIKITNIIDTISHSEGGAYTKEVTQLSITNSKLESNAAEVWKSETEVSHSLKAADLLAKQKLANIARDLQKVVDGSSVAGTETIITVVPEAVPSVVSQSAAPLQEPVREETNGRGVHRFEIIKSIVYGGLAESITSLSVVASAAGGDAATLNIVALGFANLIGGLFIVGHNLLELKKSRRAQVSNQLMEQEDEYQELLGRRENFVLHATVAVLSYIIFGLVPPVTYGFSFRKSDDKQSKIEAVAVASLLCILVLAAGKAYVQRPPKTCLKIIAVYVILGFSVSGVSYVAGDQVRRLLEKFGLFTSTSVVNLQAEVIPTKATWASF